MASVADEVRSMAAAAKRAGWQLATLSGSVRAAALVSMADAMLSGRERIVKANEEDVAAAAAAGLAAPLLKRLRLTDKELNYMDKRMRELAKLPDPLGIITKGTTQPSGLKVHRLSVPLGVVAVIFESRPNVASDSAAVCIMSGNACILRGGSEATRTTAVLYELLETGARSAGLPDGCLNGIRTTDRAAVGALLTAEDLVDVIVPRGGPGLIKRVAAESKVPVIKHYSGVCHQYVAADADVEMAVRVVENSKCQSVEVCNALETVLVDAAIADKALAPLASAMAARGVTLRCCPASRAILAAAGTNAVVEEATGEDWTAEYLSPMLAVRVVAGVEEAVEHINTYGSHHTDGVVTSSLAVSNAFVRAVDSASVLVNASTRLSGGGDYGLGAVIGISTDKLHARGPVGAAELTTYKWVAEGDGHLRA